MKRKFNSKLGHLEGSFSSRGSCSSLGRSIRFSCVDLTSLIAIMELNHIIVTLHHMFTPVDWLAWVNVGGGCYRVVSDHGSTLGLDGKNVFVMHLC